MVVTRSQRQSGKQSPPDAKAKGLSRTRAGSGGTSGPTDADPSRSGGSASGRRGTLLAVRDARQARVRDRGAITSPSILGLALAL